GPGDRAGARDGHAPESVTAPARIRRERYPLAGPAVHCARGAALLIVIVIMLAVTLSSGSFIWFMNQQQARAGGRYRSAAAAAVAEAGVYRAMSILESAAPDGKTGRVWRPSGHTEVYRAGPLEGRFTVSIEGSPDGALLVTSAGEVAGMTRRLRARVYLASPALLAALHGVSVVRFEQQPAAAVIIPYGAGIGDRPWIHIAAAQSIWFGSTDVSINDPAATLEAAPGPVDAPAGLSGPTMLQRPGPVRLLLPRSADLLVGDERRRFDIEQLRGAGIHVEGVVLRTDALSPLPEVDRAYYRARAEANAANAALHKAAGQFLADPALARKRDSVYTSAEFGQLLTYFRMGLRQRRLYGVVYITGGLALSDEERIEIDGGSLVTEGTLALRRGAALEVTHSASTRSLPGLIVLDGGALVITQDARLRAHGLVYVSRVIDLGPGSGIDIVGALLGGDRGLSFRNIGATAVIRYDPAVLGTPGLRAAADAPVVAWVAAWEELP
ncbi:MAG: hypothetical protein ACRDGN_09345, partial [bacterium]